MDNLYEMIQKADAGDAEAQWSVAWHIVWEEENEPIEPDWLERAVDYFERSAAQGYGDAMLDLGAMYISGRGVQRDRGKAIYWYNQAAAILHPKAFRCLGYALEIPLGYLDPNDERYEQDYGMAFGYFFKGAMLNEQNSIYKIGDMYFTGKYVDADQVFAFKLYQESYDFIKFIEDDSYASVCLRLGECVYRWNESNKGIDKAATYLKKAIKGFEIRIKRGENPRFLMEGYNRAKYLLKRIESGNKPDQADCSSEDKESNEYMAFISGDMMKYPEPQYPIAKIVERDYEKAFKYFAKCALGKNNMSYGSLTNLARMYREGIFVQRDERFAVHLENLSKKAKRQAHIEEGKCSE